MAGRFVLRNFNLLPSCEPVIPFSPSFALPFPLFLILSETAVGDRSGDEIFDPLRASGDAIEAREGQRSLGLYIKRREKEEKRKYKRVTYLGVSSADIARSSIHEHARRRSTLDLVSVACYVKGKWHLNPSYNSSIAIPLLT